MTFLICNSSKSCCCVALKLGAGSARCGGGRLSVAGRPWWAAQQIFPRGKKHKFPLSPRGFELSKPRAAGGKMSFYGKPTPPKTRVSSRRAQSPSPISSIAKTGSQSRCRKARRITYGAVRLFPVSGELRHGSMRQLGLHLEEEDSRSRPSWPNYNYNSRPWFLFWLISRDLTSSAPSTLKSAANTADPPANARGKAFCAHFKTLNSRATTKWQFYNEPAPVLQSGP